MTTHNPEYAPFESDFRRAYQSIQPPLTEDEHRTVFGQYYQVNDSGAGLALGAFTDQRCWSRFQALQEPVAQVSAKDKSSKTPWVLSAVITMGLLASLGKSIQYEADHRADDEKPSSFAGWAGVSIDGALGYFENYDHIIQNFKHRNDSKTASALPTNGAAPAPSLSKKVTATPLPTPSVSPSAIPIQAVYPKVKTIQYPHDKRGDILGLAATYTKKSGLTNEQVTQMETCGNTTQDVVLTFDDPASDKQIDAITSILKKEKVGAVFFVNVLDTPKISQAKINQLRKEGFWVGSHGGTHKDLTKLQDEKDIAEIITSGGVSTLYRPAYGATMKDPNSKYFIFDDRVKDVADSLGKNVCLWTIDTQDYVDSPKTTAINIVETVKDKVAPRSVILHHTREAETLKALPDEIAAIRAKKLSICTSSGPTTSDFSKTPLCK